MEAIMGITCVSEFPCAPGRIDELIAIYHVILPSARKKIGCEKIYFSISDTDSNLAVTFEIWSSKKQHELYLSELTESGRLSDIQFCLNGFPKFTFFNNLDDF